MVVVRMQDDDLMRKHKTQRNCILLQRERVYSEQMTRRRPGKTKKFFLIYLLLSNEVPVLGNQKVRKRIKDVLKRERGRRRNRIKISVYRSGISLRETLQSSDIEVLWSGIEFNYNGGNSKFKCQPRRKHLCIVELLLPPGVSSKVNLK